MDDHDNIGELLRRSLDQIIPIVPSIETSFGSVTGIAIDSNVVFARVGVDEDNSSVRGIGSHIRWEGVGDVEFHVLGHIANGFLRRDQVW